MKFLLNPYFIFRVLSYIFAVFIGIDLFNEKITFTDAEDGKDFSDEKKIDKGKQIATETDSETETENKTNPGIEEDKNKKYAQLSYREKMLALMQNMMSHNSDMEKWQAEETEKGTEGVISQEEMVESLVENRIQDTKTMVELTKALSETNINDENSPGDNKRSLDEDNSSENKKSKSEDKDSDINKKDNGEGPSVTK